MQACGDQVYVADVEQLQPYANDTPDRERARWETMGAAAVVGVARLFDRAAVCHRPAALFPTT